MTHLLDTNICIWLMRGVGRIVDRLEEHSPDRFAISVITLFELTVGVRKSSQPAREADRLHRLLQAFARLDFDATAAGEAAHVRAHLEAEGRGIGPFDTLIAGHARSLGLTIVTDNLDEFSRVPNLQLEHWPR